MSGRVLIPIYFLVVLAFAAFTQWHDPFAVVDSTYPITSTVGAAFGRAMAIFIGSGLIPGVIWLVSPPWLLDL